MESLSALLFLIMPLAGATLLAYGIFQVVMDLRGGEQRKMLDRLSGAKSVDRELKVRESLLRKTAAETQGNFLESLVAKLHLVKKLQSVLDQADLGWSASKVLVNLAGAALAVVLVMVLLQISPLVILLVSVAIFGLPILYMIWQRKRRIRKLVEQLPEVFDLMCQALKAGHSLASAIQLISQQMPDPVAGEFARVFQEQNLGLTVEDALLNMTKRVDQMDVRFFVTAVLIQRQTGGDLAEVLEKIGKVIRDRIQLFGVVRALTAEGRLSGWVLLLLPVLVFFGMMVVNPGYAAELTDTDSGRKMLGIAIGMDLMGMAMIKKIVNIKV
ncbi:MAG TPA: type II secretion system F family protein [Phycisphaerae bacterium]|nr:type II secretion system F family protein [Phycisphaerae bacterium]HRR83634.1 type II secretion system F family protein [Phycisphaerae bacterium]